MAHRARLLALISETVPTHLDILAAATCSTVVLSVVSLAAVVAQSQNLALCL